MGVMGGMDGLEIRSIRRNFEISQKELGDILGVSSMTILRWEKESAKPTGLIEQILKICLAVSRDGRMAGNVHRLVRTRTESAAVLWYILNAVYASKLKGDERVR